MKAEISKKEKWCYASSSLGRDLACTLVNLFFITFIQFTCGFTPKQFQVISLIIIICRIWDAFNDPLMSLIITNTKSKYGKYKPWILIGAIFNSFFLVALFISPGLKGWNYVIYLGVCYLLYGMTFTMNDISYWSLIPHLTRSKNSRDNLMALVSIFASIGQFLSATIISLASGNMVLTYRLFAIAAAISFAICQIVTFIYVKDDNEKKEQKNVSFKEMFKIIFHNDQLLVMVALVFLYSLGSVIIMGFGTNFFYLKFGYEGLYVTLFIVIFAIATLLSQIIFGKLIKKYTRKFLFTITSFIMIGGYFLFFILANIPLNLFNNFSYILLIILGLTGFVIFSSQSIHYLLILIMLTNTIEYGEWKSGNRYEAISFSLRPFMVKLSSSIQQGILTFILIVSGLYSLSQEIASLEVQKSMGLMEESTLVEQANSILSSATQSQIFILTLGMCIIPLVLYFIEYMLFKKKYKIDEEMYEKIKDEINKETKINHYE